MIELSISNVRDFKLNICEGRVVVRSYSRILGLLKVREKLIPEQYRGLLAIPVFSGSGAMEEIGWTTDIFSSRPKRMSELGANEKLRYSNILNKALRAYAEAISDATEDVKRLLYAAITYLSESSVFCGEDKVVITEWGVSPIGGREALGMPIEVDDETPEKIVRIEKSDTGNEDVKQTEEKPSAESETDNPDSKDEESHAGLSEEEPEDEKTPGETPETTSDKPQKNEKSRKKSYLWYWIIAGIILLAGIIFCLVAHACSSPMKTVIDTTPELKSENIVLSKDSLNYMASNRLMLMLTDDNATIENFVGEFRKDYPDESKYILSAPDTLLRRITLTLPDSERESMEQELPVKYNEFGLVVIPDAMYRSSSTIPNDPDLQAEDKRWYFDECGVFEAWDETMGDPDVVVAIIDDGFDLDHPELKGKAYKPFNAVNHTSVITPSPEGHGTHVASTAIGNANNSTGVAGIAPKCKFMPIQVGDSRGNMSSSAIIDGVLYAIGNGADVVNMSLGMYFGPGVQFMPVYFQDNIRNFYFKQEEYMWNRIFEMARQKDVTFVLAGGNENILIGIDPMVRSNNTIKVSAIGEGRNKANFSNYGDLSTVSAPGVHIYNAVPGNKYTFMDGTSMAAPIVTGGCALLRSKDPTLSTSEMARILRTTGNTPTGPVGPIVNFAQALKGNDDSDMIAEETSCSDVGKRYAELLAELEQLKREHPGCIQEADTMEIPENLSVNQVKGRWKSTNSILNSENDKVTIYFSFSGTDKGQLDIVEPSGMKFSAPLTLSVKNDILYIDQNSPATNPGSLDRYPPYKFVIRPDKHRNAEGKANNKAHAYDAFNFSLVRI